MANLRKNALLWKGNPVDVVGPQLRVGDAAPANFTLAANDLSPVLGSDLAGKPRVLLAVPSLDTPVCDLETRRFNMEAAQFGKLGVWAISMDLPFAQKRWCGAAGVERVRTLSDYKDRSFGEAYGVLVPDKGLLTRAVFVIDGHDKLRHVEYVRDATQEPDYAKALEAIRAML